MSRKLDHPLEVPSDCSGCPVRDCALHVALASGDGIRDAASKRAARSLPAGAVLYSERQRHPWIHAIVDGWVALYVVRRTGQRQILDFGLSGSLLAYTTASAGSMSRAAQCLTDVSTCTYPRAALLEMVDTSPVVRCRLSRLREQALTSAWQHLANVAGQPARVRVASCWLLPASSGISTSCAGCKPTGESMSPVHWHHETVPARTRDLRQVTRRIHPLVKNADHVDGFSRCEVEDEMLAGRADSQARRDVWA